MRVHVLDTPELGDRSYVVDDGTTALVVDAQRDIDRVEAYLDAEGLVLGLVVETHIHNDYVTGGHSLARRHGARYAVHAEDPVCFERQPVADGDELVVGGLAVRAIATPGHTFTHLSFAVHDGSDGPPAVFTGGSLLYGAVGRPDLLGDQHTRDLARAQHRSARRLVALLPPTTAVFPTHGFGSFCSSGSSADATSGTLADERRRNDALTTDDEQEFVDRVVRALGAAPAYYAHMAPRNLAGPEAPDLEAPPTPVDPSGLARRLRDGGWVVDLRDGAAFADRHLPGSVSISLSPQFSTYVGWVLPWDDDLVLVGDTADQVAQAQRQLARIGREELAGAATGDVGGLAAGTPPQAYARATFAELDAAQGTDDGPAPVVLDVRRDEEVAAGRLPGSVHVPVHALLSRLPDVPDGRVWVHCASGFRAAVAASLLAREGRDVVHVDDDLGAHLRRRAEPGGTRGP